MGHCGTEKLRGTGHWGDPVPPEAATPRSVAHTHSNSGKRKVTEVSACKNAIHLAPYIKKGLKITGLHVTTDAWRTPMADEHDGPTLFIISRMFQMLRTCEGYVPKSKLLKMEMELRGFKEGFIARNGFHPMIKAKRGPFAQVIDNTLKTRRDDKAILRMVNAAYYENILPGRSAELSMLRMELLRKEPELSESFLRLIEEVVETVKHS